MAQIKRAEAQVEVNCNADKLFSIWGCDTPQLSKICPDKFAKVELVKGENCHTPGAVIRWTFVTPVDGKQEIVHTMLDDIDINNRKFTYILFDGEMMEKHYKNWKGGPVIIPKDENSCIVKWTISEYEKKSEDAPDAVVYVKWLLDSFNDVARHISSA